MKLATQRTPGTLPVLEESKKAYETSVEELATVFPIGYYAVFVKAAFLGAFSSYSEALDKGYDRAGNIPFFVKQIKCAPEIQCVVSPILVDA